MEDILIVGGGLAGLVSAIKLSQSGHKVMVVEKKEYPFHRVCGEYISNEVLPFFESIGIKPQELGASKISRLEVSAPSGKLLKLNLDLGGFGVSRYTLDFKLYKIAVQNGVEFFLNQQVTGIDYKDNNFEVSIGNGITKKARMVIGSYGKRSNLDRQLDRAFFKKKSPYMGIKYHIRTDHPDDLISLHIFKDGYCGISKIEDNKYCLCYLSLRENLKGYESIRQMEVELLSKNPYLKYIFESSEFIFQKPEVINEISFDKKTTVEKHILMTGDAVGMISPLCGNGMAMAIHSAKILSEIIIKNWSKSEIQVSKIEEQYKIQWNKLFANRVVVGRTIQNIFGNSYLTEACITILQQVKPAGKYLINQTHGKPF